MPRLPLNFRRRKNHLRHIVHFEGVLGTSLEIQVVATEQSRGPQAEEAVLVEIDRLEAIFNAYRPDSELRRWQSTFEKDVPISSELSQVLFEAEHWRHLTSGTFNPAVEALTRIWANHAAQNQPVQQHDLSPVLSQMQGPLWTVDRARGTACRLTTLPVTLNAIAKGFIIDSACRVARAIPGVEEVLINIGGDIRHGGSKPVPVAIADPNNDSENAVPADRVQIQNQGIATSGNYRRGFQIQGRWYSHILDPRTGWPVEHTVGVSVVADNALIADVLSTAFSVLEPDQSLKLADSVENVGVLLLSAEKTRHSNSHWEKGRIL